MQPKVEVLANGQAWTVCIQDADGDHSVPFEREESAHNYAMGQRRRLGLPDGPLTARPSGEGHPSEPGVGV